MVDNTNIVLYTYLQYSLKGILYNMTISAEHRVMIDESLQKFASHEQERLSRADVPAEKAPNIETLRQSYLGQSLEQLAEIAEQGLTSMGRTQAKGILKDVYTLFFQGPLQERPYIPASFDRTPLGQMLLQAKVRILDLQDVVNVTEASKLSGIARAQLYLMLETGYLHSIDMNNRAMIEREELARVVQERQQAAKEESK